MQKTLKTSVEISGIGLHSGCASKLVLHPAAADSGIIFVRSDLSDGNIFPALYNNVVDTRNCTCLGNSSKQLVSTIEHIMATLYALKIDNALIEIDNPEVPIMDGSALAFLNKLKDEDLEEVNVKRKVLRVKKDIEFTDDKGNFIKLAPSDELQIHFVIDFPSAIVGHQEFKAIITPQIFAKDVASARTFCEKYQVDYLRSIGLIKGGSLENAVVLDGNNILNEGGFRTKNECVNHKVLDCIGDLYTSGYRIKAKVTAYHTGHFHNNELLKKLFADSDNYEIVEE